MTANQSTTDIKNFNYKNQDFKFEMGQKYNLKNGYAFNLEGLWLNDSEFMGFEFYGNESLLKFKHNENVFFVDMDAIFKYDSSIKVKCWQYCIA
jgi:hypothetical protein